jgi:adenylate kinase
VRRIVGICGTPGTGKKTVAPLVARMMELPAVSINSLVPKGKVDVETAILRRKTSKVLPTRAILYGHLLPHVLSKSDAGFVAVLRCEPEVLRKRLESRGYSQKKVLENVEAELIGVVLDECVRRYGAELVHEFDTSSSLPRAVAKRIARGAEASAARGSGGSDRARPEWIDWTLNYDSSSKLRSLLAAGRAPPPST